MKPQTIHGKPLLTMDDLDHVRMAWRDLSPSERARRSLRMRKLLKNPEAAHDAKHWPKP
jgi:hypothetical protein